MKISNMTSKTSLEINDTDILIIEDIEGTKQVSIQDLRQYLLDNGITKSTKILINDMMDNVIESLKACKYMISELVTHRMNITINDVTSGNIYITLQNVGTGKWLTVQDIQNLLIPNEDGMYTRKFDVQINIDDVYIKCTSYTIHDASEINTIIPKDSMGCLCVHFDGLEQNDIANLSYEDIIITLEHTEITFVLPIEDMHEYQFIGDPNMFKNHVPYIQNLG